MVQRVPTHLDSLLASTLGASATVGGLCHAAERRSVRRRESSLELLGTFEAVAEIAIALTGFTAVVVALGQRELSVWSPIEKFQLRALLYWSLGTAFLAFVPAGLSGLAPNTAWRLAHSAFVIFHTSAFAWYFHQARSLDLHSFPFGRLSVAVARLSIAVGLGILLAEASVALGLVLRPAPYLYLLALLWFLYLAASVFVGLVVRRLSGEGPAA